MNLLQWKQERLIWIGFMKEDATYCNLKKLPKDLIAAIILWVSKIPIKFISFEKFSEIKILDKYNKELELKHKHITNYICEEINFSLQNGFVNGYIKNIYYQPGFFGYYFGYILKNFNVRKYNEIKDRISFILSISNIVLNLFEPYNFNDSIEFRVSFRSC